MGWVYVKDAPGVTVYTVWVVVLSFTVAPVHVLFSLNVTSADRLRFEPSFLKRNVLPTVPVWV